MERRLFRQARSCAVVVGATVVLAHAWIFAEDRLDAALETLPGEIQEINSAGRWRTAEAQGFYRVIVLRGGYERIAQRLYVQWMLDGDSERPPRVVVTAGIAAINDPGPFTFTHVLHAAATNQLQITIEARHGYTGQRHKFAVVATKPGIYTARVVGTHPSRE